MNSPYILDDEKPRYNTGVFRFQAKALSAGGFSNYIEYRLILILRVDILIKKECTGRDE